MSSIFKSIRWRLQAWHGLLLLAVLVAFGATAYYLALENRLRRVDHELQRRAAMLLGAFLGGGHAGEKRGGRNFREAGPGSEHRGGPFWRGGERPDPIEARLPAGEAALFEGGGSEAYYFALWDFEGSPLRQSTNAPAGIPKPELPGAPAASAMRSRGGLREFAQQGPRGLCLVVGRDVAPEYAEVRHLAWHLSGACGGVLVLGLFGGWWLTARALRPIQAISATAKIIAEGDLAQRISTDNTETELGQLAAVLNSTFARLEAAFAQQVRFTSDAAHELRTPVTVLLTQTQAALARERPAGEYREALEASQRAAQRMRRLIESLLELARLDAGQEPLPRGAFNLSQTAAECLELVRPLAEPRHLELRAELPAVACFGAPERIAQVITNLLTNAIYYNREAGMVRVRIKSQPHAVVLEVEDTGPGIPPADLPHLFERFYRVDKARARTTGHTGLGLSISKAIVEAHGGKISVASHLGTGSTFTVELPAKPETRDRV